MTSSNAEQQTGNETTSSSRRSERCCCMELVCLSFRLAAILIAIGVLLVLALILLGFGVNIFEVHREQIRKKLVRQESDVEQSDGCCEICLEDFDDASSVNNNSIVGSPNPACSHVFHEECIVKWLERKRTCPCCRAPYLENAATTDIEEGTTEDVSEEEEEYEA